VRLVLLSLWLLPPCPLVPLSPCPLVPLSPRFVSTQRQVPPPCPPPFLASSLTGVLIVSYLEKQAILAPPPLFVPNTPSGDLKPENLLLADTPQGLVLKIADFGLSALLTGGDDEFDDKGSL
jgi:serine/threonine protein kinase